MMIATNSSDKLLINAARKNMREIYALTVCCLLNIGITNAQNADNHMVWSDTPAYTVLFENQDNGIRKEKPAKTWHEGEGTNYLLKSCDSITHGKYPNPIRLWEAEPYPIGNGRLAASVFHGNLRDRYSLNEVSFWSGGRNAGTINNKGDKGYDVSGPEVNDDGFGSYQPVGDLIVDFNAPVQSGFVRQITLDKGIVESSAKRNGNYISSSAFCSYPNQVMVIRYESQKRKKLDLHFSFATQRKQDITTTHNRELSLYSRLKNGMECETLVKVAHEGGQLTSDKNGLHLKGADNCTLLIYMATNYEMNAENGFRGISAKERLKQQTAQATSRSYDKLLKAHISDYQNLYQRQELNIANTTDSNSLLPTPKRLAAYRETHADNGLEELIFRFGRYLMIQTSRPGSLPAGLQGIWNGMIAAPWGNDYHSNINFQMVYWLPEVGNLSECHMPMLDYLNAMRKPFKENTQEYLKAIGEPVNTTPDNDGWIVYTSHNPFGAGGWQVNLPGAAWYGLHLWEHYAFTNDTTYLRQCAYPMMKELCHYWQKHLKSLGEGGKGFCSNYQPVDVSKYPELKSVKEGTLVVPFGWSPEHGPRGEDGVAHDQEIVAELFMNTIKAAQILGVDDSWTEQLQDMAAHLYTPQIGKKGNLMEWMIDRDPETDHRHTSHLFAVFPGSTISIDKTPALAEAARKSLMFRKTTGDSRRSWAWTWRSLLWARLHDGEQAHNMIEGLISYNMLDNLFTSHKIPLQIDGNYGIAAAMIEMLLQSHSDIIELMPASCPQWRNGNVRGLKARGNIEVDFSWKDGKVTSWKLYSPQPREVKVRVNGVEQTVTTSYRK